MVCFCFKACRNAFCITGEVAPFSKTGGLGEAMDGLPIALAALGHRCMVVSPRYDQYAEAWDTGYWGQVNMGGKHLGSCHLVVLRCQKRGGFKVQKMGRISWVHSLVGESDCFNQEIRF